MLIWLIFQTQSHIKCAEFTLLQLQCHCTTTYMSYQKQKYICVAYIGWSNINCRMHIIGINDYQIYAYILGNERPQLKDIDNYVVIKCAANWKQLGRNLNISEDLLNIIEKDYSYCEDCCSKMLNDWLDSKPDASWGILLTAVDKAQNTLSTLPDAGKNLDIVAEKLLNTVEKLDTVAENFPHTVVKLDIAAEKFTDTVTKVDTATEKLSHTVEKLDTAAEKFTDTVKKVDIATEKLPHTVEKLDTAAGRLPKVVDQLCNVIERAVGISHTTEDVVSAGTYILYNNTFVICICTYVYGIGKFVYTKQPGCNQASQ